jgi:hypothetical protein
MRPVPGCGAQDSFDASFLDLTIKPTTTRNLIMRENSSNHQGLTTSRTGYLNLIVYAYVGVCENNCFEVVLLIACLLTMLARLLLRYYNSVVILHGPVIICCPRSFCTNSLTHHSSPNLHLALDFQNPKSNPDPRPELLFTPSFFLLLNSRNYLAQIFQTS